MKVRRVLVRSAGGLMAAAMLLCAAGPMRAETSLPVLAEVGPWPTVSNLIGYRGRLWLVNSVVGRNHNSADVYSYDPGGGDLRYEAHLFSQDSGRPAVARGLLYWPFEDSRASAGWGHYMVTDGEAWRLGTIPTAEIFHAHAMLGSGGRLLAATSAWRAGLQVSEDGGNTWHEIYDHPTREKRVSRIVDLIAIGGRVLAYLATRDRKQVLRLEGARIEPLSDWPEDGTLRGWTPFGDWVYALVERDAGTALWRTDGLRAAPVGDLRPDWRPRALTAGGGALWAVSPERDGGILWRSTDGRDWQIYRRLQGGRPQAVAVYGGRVYVGGSGADGRGLLWGERLVAALGGQPVEPAPMRLAERPMAPAAPDVTEPLAAALDAALANLSSYEHHGDPLRDLVYQAVRRDAPASFWTARLAAPMPRDELSLVGGNATASAQTLGRWIVLWGMSLAGRGRVPLAFLREPWTTPSNPSEKYFTPPPGAIWTAGMIGQDDAQTMSALIDRLDRVDDPLWLTGDVVGALTALTGQRFGYDRAAWRAWWTEAQDTWPR